MISILWPAHVLRQVSSNSLLCKMSSWRSSWRHQSTMTTLSDDVIFWTEVQWNGNDREPQCTCLTGPLTNPIKDHGLIRKTLTSLCNHSYFKAYSLIELPTTTFDAALADLSYAQLDGMSVKAASVGLEDRGPQNLAFTLRLHH